MAYRVPSKTTQKTNGLSQSVSMDPDWLATYIREANRPVAIDMLARQAVRAMVVSDGHLRAYAAGRSHRKEERVRLLDGRLGDILSVETGSNDVQGTFEILSLRMRDGDIVRVAARVEGAPEIDGPELVPDDIVDMLLVGQEEEMVRLMRRALVSDPRFITLYYSEGEYGCLREFFPPMSPDVLDAALAVLLDALFDQIPLSQTSRSLPARGLTGRKSAEVLIATDRLDGELSSNPEWLDSARIVFDTVRSLWARAEQYDAVWDAAQVSRAFLQPLLRALGWTCVPLPTQDRPDGLYALCADHLAASELYVQYQEGEAMTPWVLAMAQATSWGRTLDHVATLGGPGTPPGGIPVWAGDAEPVAPAHQMVGALRRSDVRWGVLTNGRVWRLFSRDANSLSRAYYEVDLADVFDGLQPREAPENDRWEAFRRWWLLFRQASYVPGADGRCLLESLREHEPQASQQVRDILRKRLLTTALPAVAGGFVSYRAQRTGIGAETAATLGEIRRGSVRLLARMLFLLIAEARDLLPLSDPDYRPHSLTAQAQWAVERVRRELPPNDGVYTTPRYDIILSLLHRISKGDPEKGLPSYGRLFFDPAESDHAFLEKTKLSDEALALALDALFRGIDYTALDARDLVQVASTLLGSQITVPNPEVGEVMVTHGGGERGRRERVRRERVGWAALPDYVVKPAVEQALAPVLGARDQVFADAMDQVVALRKKLRRALDRTKRSALHAEWDAAARAAREAFLGIHVCDPAMGAGEFLMSAVDVLTDGIIERLQAYHADHPDVPRDWNPICRQLDDLRRDIVEEMGRQKIQLQPGELTDATLLSRLVAQRTIFGVSEDPLAVELIQAGLWLHTFTPGAPLGFLSHHLRCGNSLLGATLPEAAKRLGIAGVEVQVLDAFDTLYASVARVDATPLDVRWSAAQFGKWQDALKPYRMLLDLVVSAELGSPEADTILQAVEADRWQESLALVAGGWAGGQAAGARFLHWPLDFPEIFVDLATGQWKDDPGFDLVIGTPPWTEPADQALAAFYAARFGDGDRDYDVHHAFLTLARHLVRRSGGHTSHVLSREWLATPTGSI